MLVKEILKNTKPSYSFEFFPPKKEEDWEGLFDTIADLESLKPSYVSVTYGAGGTTRDRTHQLIVRLKKETDLTVVSHLTCVGASKDDTKKILDLYAESGIDNILALRGDPPKGDSEWRPAKNGFLYAAELVAFIRKHFPHVGIGVAGFPEGHPATPNRLQELDYLKAKVDAGADYIVTQLFFDNRDFFDFVERCRLAGIEVPIIAGIMPITSRSGMVRMAELAAGARIPAKLLKAVARANDDTSVTKVGIHWATEQVRDLIDNDVDGIHFYTLNKAKATQQIYETLNMASPTT